MKYSKPLKHERIFNAINHKLLPEEKRSSHYDILLRIDNELVDIIFVIMSSMRRNLLRNVRFWIFQSNFNDIHKSQLRQYGEECGIELHIINEIIEVNSELNLTPQLRQTYFNLNSINLLPTEVKRALIIDIDTLFIKDIANLYDIDFGEAYIVGGKEYDHNKYDDHLNLYEEDMHFKKEDFVDAQADFNSGVILLNLAKLRAEFIGMNESNKLCTENGYGSFLKIPLKDRYFKDNGKTIKKSNLDYSNLIICYPRKNSINPWEGIIGFHEDGSFKFKNGLMGDSAKYIEKWWDFANSIPLEIYDHILYNSIHYDNQQDNV